MNHARRLRVGTVNLQHATPVDGERATPAALHAAGRTLADLDLDLLALQEVDRGQRRSGYVDQTKVLARLLGAPWWCLAPAELGPRPGPTLRAPAAAFREPAAAFRAPGPIPRAPARARGPLSWLPAYGVGLVSRLPVRAWHASTRPGRLRLLPDAHPLARGPVLRLGRRVLRRDEARADLVAEVAGPAGPLAVGVTHLGTDPDDAAAHLADLAHRLGRLPGPHLLAGDLNLAPDAVARVGDWSALGVGATFPARAPARQIDHVLGGPGLTAVASEVHRLPVSDHAALVAVVELAGAGGPSASSPEGETRAGGNCGREMRAGGTGEPAGPEGETRTGGTGGAGARGGETRAGDTGVGGAA